MIQCITPSMCNRLELYLLYFRKLGLPAFGSMEKSRYLYRRVREMGKRWICCATSSASMSTPPPHFLEIAPPHTED